MKIKRPSFLNFIRVGVIIFGILQIIAVFLEYHNWWVTLGSVCTAFNFYMLGYLQGNKPYQRLAAFIIRAYQAQQERK